MIVFIVCPFLRPARSLGIRRIAYEFYCSTPRCSVNQKQMHSSILPDQRSINIKALISLKLTPREAEVLFWISQGKSNHDIGVILGAKTGTICKHVEHIFAKLNVENRTAAAFVALETYRSAAPAPESKPGQAWGAITGFITTQLCALCSEGPELYGKFARLVA